jgi:hypothetical protein
VVEETLGGLAGAAAAGGLAVSYPSGVLQHQRRVSDRSGGGA